MQKRNIALDIVLSIITCGIYYYFWVYKTHENINFVVKNENYKFQRETCQEFSMSGGMTILLGIITCGIYFWFFYYKCGDVLDSVQFNKTGMSGNNSILYLILAIFIPVVSIGLITNELNKYGHENGYF